MDGRRVSADIRRKKAWKRLLSIIFASKVSSVFHNSLPLYQQLIFVNILYVYQADKSPNTNFCFQAKFFICLYTYYEGHYRPKKLLNYCWTWKIIQSHFTIKTPIYTLYKGKIPIRSTSKSRHKSTIFLANNDPHNVCKNI